MCLAFHPLLPFPKKHQLLPLHFPPSRPSAIQSFSLSCALSRPDDDSGFSAQEKCSCLSSCVRENTNFFKLRILISFSSFQRLSLTLHVHQRHKIRVAYVKQRLDKPKTSEDRKMFIIFCVYEEEEDENN